MSRQMINPKEIRIGNILQPLDGARQVVGIKEREVMYFGRPFFVSIEVLSPVKLTEEWLVNLGFEETHRGGRGANYWAPNRFGVHHKLIGDDILDAGFYWGELYTKIEYVHDLQNLYFAITRKELALKH